MNVTADDGGRRRELRYDGVLRRKPEVEVGLKSVTESDYATIAGSLT